MGAVMSTNKPVSKESIQSTVARLRASREKASTTRSTTTEAIKNTDQSVQMTQRVSKNTTSVSTTDRKKAANHIIKRLLFSELTEGQALKELRINVLGLKQDVYAKLVNVSRKTLSDIENDRGNYKTDILNKVFKPFGLKAGLIPSSPSMLNSLIHGNETLVED
ncbi:helix-turn-helix domain-containing protein [Vibrio sp. DW001]|uniref:helix-turn-helix transcriptional regulator n=1 Tax=Vibrio sp. DW001 TaxID=2912315 RepID=UPI0023B1C3AE|nr:helix-turn-helix transcriptional regulator [Vibrio sp. DW001]WED27292.1 helix-turn-helix domain-containing protein [Vibrio sp. DW001]